MARHQQKHHERSKPRAAGNAARGAEQVESSVHDMGERAERVAHQLSETAQEGTRQFAIIGEKAFESWLSTSNEALRRVIEVNVELAAWSHEQVDDSINAVRSLAQCRTVGDAYGVQLGLMRSSMEKSIRHASNVLNLAAHAMIEGSRMAQQNGARRAALMRMD